MIVRPTNQQQATDNAILAAEEAHTAALSGKPYPADTWAHVSEAWSRVADLLPVFEDDRPTIKNDGSAPSQLEWTEYRRAKQDQIERAYGRVPFVDEHDGPDTYPTVRGSMLPVGEAAFARASSAGSTVGMEVTIAEREAILARRRGAVDLPGTPVPFNVPPTNWDGQTHTMRVMSGEPITALTIQALRGVVGALIATDGDLIVGKEEFQDNQSAAFKIVMDPMGVRIGSIDA